MTQSTDTFESYLPAISDHLNQLDHQEKVVFILKHYDKRSFDEIAILLNQKKSKIEMQFCSAVEKIINHLQLNESD